MRFDQPHFLYALIIIPVIAGLLHALYARHQRISDRFIAHTLIDQQVLKQKKRNAQIQAIYLVIGMMCAIIALARPQWGKTEEVIKREGLDILIAVDVSKSMLTQDVRPTRLERTQWAIKDLVKQLKGDRVGLMAFAGEAFMMCPLTLDYSGFLLSVDDLSPSVIPRGGTSISVAIQEAIRNYEKAAGHDKALVIITDGEELEGDALTAARKAKDQHIKIFTVGVGTKEGDLIEFVDDKGSTQFLKDDKGNVVKSRLNEDLLQSIAYETGGAYVRSSPTEFGLDFLYDKQLALIPKQELEAKKSIQYHDRFQWPLTIAIIFFILAFFPITIKFPRLGVVLVLLCCCPSYAFAKSTESLVREGNKYFRQQKYDQSVEMYQQALAQDPSSDEVRYNLGSALYKNHLYEQSIDPLLKASSSPKKSLAQQASYNAGNSLFRAGMSKPDEEVEKAVDMVTQAIKKYDDALQLNQRDKSAQANKKIATTELERLKEKLKKQQQQKKSGGSSNNKDKSDSKDKSEGADKSDTKDQSAHQDQSKNNKEDNNKDQSSSSKPEDDKKSSESTPKESKSSDQKSSSNDASQGSAAQQAAEDQAALDKKQALEALEDYQRVEGQQGMLYLHDKKSDERPVGKDW